MVEQRIKGRGSLTVDDSSSIILTFSVFALLHLVVGGSGIRSVSLLDAPLERCCCPGEGPAGRTQHPPSHLGASQGLPGGAAGCCC